MFLHQLQWYFLSLLTVQLSLTGLGSASALKISLVSQETLRAAADTGYSTFTPEDGWIYMDFQLPKVTPNWVQFKELQKEMRHGVPGVPLLREM